MDTYQISSPQDFIIPAQDLIKKKSKQIFLHGPLGAGKTTFVQARLKAVTGKDIPVTSPTYTYFNRYDPVLLHVDMRRIEQSDQLHELGFFELLDQYEYCAIERPKRTEQYVQPGQCAHVTITKLENDNRTVHIDYSTTQTTT